MSLELRDLSWSIIASLHRSLLQAAEALNVRQSTLSRRLRDMESRLGARLFERTNGGTHATIAGQEQQPGPDLHVYGSANLLQTLLKHDLVDALWLKIYPLTLGGGKRLFADGTIPAAFKVTESKVSPTGIIIVNYERAGAVTTGSVL
jgi:dihydrofolate reductase